MGGGGLDVCVCARSLGPRKVLRFYAFTLDFTSSFVFFSCRLVLFYFSVRRSYRLFVYFTRSQRLTLFRSVLKLNSYPPTEPEPEKKFD